MDPDDDVCLCFHVPLRKIRSFLERENPPVASLISECLGAGTGCQWCVPFLKHLHDQHTRGETPDLKISPQKYIEARAIYRVSGTRDADITPAITAPDATNASDAEKPLSRSPPTTDTSTDPRPGSPASPDSTA